MASRQKGSPRRFVLTGCASGIGRHLTLELLQRGHRVLATDVDAQGLETLAHDAADAASRLLTEPLDVCDPEAWERVLDRADAEWDGFDGVMNIAGVLRPAEVKDLTVDDVHFHFDINVKGVIFGTRAAARRLVKRAGGSRVDGPHIVNVASLASLAPIPGMSLYSASKYAVRAFSLAAASELRTHGIAVTAVCPDAVATPMLDLQLDYPEAALTFTAPKVLTVEDVASVILRKVLPKRPLMVAFPRSRALLARFADLFPGAQNLIAGVLRRQGLKKQQRAKERAAQR